MAEAFSFNLVDERWLPCLVDGGPGEKLSLREVLARAHEVREIVDASPLVTAAAHRLLLAILHRCFGPASDEAWADLWQRDSFDTRIIDGYLDKWRHRFDLFDTERPFYQTTGLSSSSAGPIAKLTHELNAGNNPSLFDHSLDDAPHPLSPSAAARYLITLQPFAVGGLVSFHKGEEGHRSADNAPLVKGALVLLVGNSLWETLLLNMVNLNGAASAPFEFDPAGDLPAWEQEDPVTPSDRLPNGYLDLLTWQSRRALLLPQTRDGAVVVPRMVLMKGFQFPGSADMHARETMLAFQLNEGASAGEDPWPPLGFRPEHALWRDSLALLQKMPDRRRIPRTLAELAYRLDGGGLQPDHAVKVAVLGMGSARAKVLLWRHERLPLPLAYLRDPELVAELERGITSAENVRTLLGRRFAVLAYYLLIPGWDELSPSDQEKQRRELTRKPAGKKSRLDNLFSTLNWERPYWSSLDSAFRPLMIGLAQAWGRGEQDGPLRAWAAALRDAANEAFEGAVRVVEASGRGLRAAAEARASLHAQLSRELGRFLPDGKEGTA